MNSSVEDDHPYYFEEIMNNYPLRLLTFLKNELNFYPRSLNIPHSTPLSRYLQRYNIVEMYLDNILKNSDNSKLPSEVTFIIYYCELSIFLYIVVLLNNTFYA